MSIARFEHVSKARFEADSAAYEDKLTVEEVALPHRATAGSAGYDFVSPVSCCIMPGGAKVIPTGIRAWMETAWVLLLFPRSSLGFKWGIRLANTTGVIDSDYYGADNEGHIMVKLINDGEKPFELKKGDRFCQGIFLPYGLAEEETSAASRSGGFGSTGQ